MTHVVRALATPPVAVGLRLAGLRAVGVAPDGDLAEALRTATTADCGILLVEQPLLDALPEVERRQLERRALPILVPFPAPAWRAGATGAEDYVLELLRRAIGYRVRLT